MNNTSNCKSARSSNFYSLIENSSWEEVLAQLVISENATQIWNVDSSSTDCESVVWRKLPIHEACIKNAPVEVICGLVNAYPEGVKSVDSFGRLPLHHACFHNAFQDTLEILLNVYPDAVDVEDIWGYVPCITASRDEKIEVDGVCIPVRDTMFVLEAVEVELKAIQAAQQARLEQNTLYSKCLQSDDTNEIECAISANADDSEQEEEFESLRYEELFEKCGSATNRVHEGVMEISCQKEALEQDKECFNEELESLLTKHALEIAAFEKLIDDAKEKSSNYSETNRAENRDDYVENYTEAMERNFDGLEDQLLKVLDSYEELMESLQSQESRFLEFSSNEIEMKLKVSELEIRGKHDSKTIAGMNDAMERNNMEYDQKIDEMDIMVEKFEEQKEKYIQTYEQYKLTASKLVVAEIKLNESNGNLSVVHENSSTTKLEEELKQKLENYVELEKKYNAVSVRATSLEKIVENHKTSSSENIDSSFKEKYEEKKRKCQDITVKLRFATSQITLLENEVHEYSKRNVDVEKMRTASMRELHDVTKDNYLLQQDLSLNSSIISLFKVKAKEDNNRIATLEESISILKDALVAQKIKCKNMYYEQASKQVEVLGRELEKERSMNYELQRKNAYTTARLNNIEHMLSSGNQEQSSGKIGSDMKEMEKNYCELKNNYDKVVSTATSLEELVCKYRKEVTELTKSKAAFQEKKNGERRYNSLEKEFQELKNHSSDCMDRNDSEQRDTIRNETNSQNGRDDFPSDLCTDVHRSRTSTVSNYKGFNSSNAVNIRGNVSSPKDDNFRKMSELCDVSSRNKQKLGASDTSLDHSKHQTMYASDTSSETNASQRTVYGVTLRHIDEGILD